MRALRKLWKDNRGLATSLMEVSLVLAISAVISSVAISLTNDQLSAADIQNCNGELKLIGVSILSFMQDNHQPPAFKRGTATGPGDAYYAVLESGGNLPSDLTETWPAQDTRDGLGNHLNTNTPGGVGGVEGAGAAAYPRVGEIPYDRHQGWNGPYLSKIPPADPWGMKYMTNVGLATTQGANTLALGTGRRPAVIVISAGPNQVLETPYAQAADEFQAGGDDVVFRVQ